MSQLTLTIKDETFSGKVLNQLSISIENEKTTVREIIKARVTAEVESYNQKVTGFYNGLVQPKDAEIVLNGFKLKSKQFVDAEQQIYTALNAFQKNSFFVLIDKLQVEDLDEEVLVSNTSDISFIKLTPLVGG